MNTKLIALLAALTLIPISGCGKSDGGASAPAASKSAKKETQKEAKKSSKKKGKYEEMDSVSGGSIKGTISFKGEAKDSTVTITADTAVCNPGNVEGGVLPEGAVVVSEAGQVKNAIVYIDGIKKGKKIASRDVEIDNVACAFSPRVNVGIKKGNLQAKNSDEAMHNTHIRLKSFEKNVALAKKGSEEAIPLKKAGMAKITCDAHGWMKAFVQVLEHPYGTVTDAAGGFELGDVPAGDYTVKVWHETLAPTGKEAKVTVKAGEAASLDVTL